jgi:hypothetical protein
MEADTCTIADNMGTCTEIPAACPENFDPVCGCDGETYSNDCHRLAAGASLSHDGECEVTIPDCLASCLETAGGQRDSDSVTSVLRSLGDNEATYELGLTCDACCRRQCLEDARALWKASGATTALPAAAVAGVSAALDRVCVGKPSRPSSGVRPVKLAVVATEEFLKGQVAELKVSSLERELEAAKTCSAKSRARGIRYQRP